MLALLIARLAFAANAHPVSPPYDGNCQSPTWSRDGAKLSYEVNYHDRKVIELYVYEPGSREPRRVRPIGRGTTSLTAGFDSAGGENVAHEVSWAPPIIDRFVYSVSTAARDYDLAIDRAGPIAAAPGADGGPDWSPDGHWIVFTSARTGQGDLYLLDAHALESPPRRLTEVPEASELYARFSPDSRSVAYVVHTARGDNLFVIDDIENPEPRRLTDWPHAQTRPSWSPDGRYIAFYANKDVPSRFDLYVVPAKGGRPFPVARGVALSHDGPPWTPDGRSLVYVLDDDDRYDPVYIAPFDDPGAARPVPTGTVGNGDLAVARGTDGRTWLAVAAQGLERDEVRDFKRIYVMPLD